MKKPQGFKYFQLICNTLLQNIQNYLTKNILPILKSKDISVKDFQKYRQAMKVVMEIFLLNDARTL